MNSVDIVNRWALYIKAPAKEGAGITYVLL
jgi:hypothetical protein